MHGRLGIAGRSALILTASALALIVAAACTQDFDQFFQGAAPTGVATGGGGTGGGGVECDAPADCGGLDTTCEYRSCVDRLCGMAFAPARTACTEDGGRVCDSAGNCVECTVQSDCEDDELCQSAQCVSAACLNDTMDNGETDVDCGGPDCNPCPNDDDCLLARDCESRFCDTTSGSVCAACTGDPDCATATDTWCDDSVNSGSCVDQKADGDLCDGDNECLNGHCPGDDGLCCDTACGGRCQACLGSKTGGTNGVCDFVEANQDYDSECGDDGAASCGSNGSGCTGDSLSCILYANGTECVAQACSGNVLVQPRQCDGSGFCQTSTQATCPSGYRCNAGGTACRTDCTLNTHCLASHFCNGGGSCQGDQILGASCNSGQECLSTFCPGDDGLCCDAACNDFCMSCTGTQTGGNDGDCDPVPGGTDPEGDCLPGAPCGRACDGNATPACTSRCADCATLYPIGGAILDNTCGQSYDECVLRINSNTADCETVCQTGGGSCVRYNNDSPNGTCGIGAPGACPGTGHSSAICTCSHGCGQNPPCNPSTQTCNGTSCS